MKTHVLVWLMVLGSALTACKTAPKKTSSEDPKSETPKLLKPVVKKIWIPPVIKNGGMEWEEGHYLYRIEKETTWSR